MNYEHLKNLIDEAIAHLQLLAYDLTYVGDIDFSDNLITEGQICLYRVMQLLDDLGRQQQGD
ncbi:MAG: hypothetical protein Q8R51_02730 [Azonexus sp.]|nr:hypothetical protein [Azonexus sp.]